MSTNLLNFLKNEICESVTLIINQSLTTGIFPNKLNIAKVIPLLKKKVIYSGPPPIRPPLQHALSWPYKAGGLC